MNPAQLQQIAQVLRHRNDMIQAHLQYLRQRRGDRRRRRRRRLWTRGWILRRHQFGLYHQLLVELRAEDQRSFKNFMRMPPEMFDELLARLLNRLTKEDTHLRNPLEPGLKLAITLRHLACGSTYTNMQYSWRVPHNSISVLVREVCEAIIAEYNDELMDFPTDEQGWRDLADRFFDRWNFPHTIGAIDGKHVACKCPANSGSKYYNYKGYYSILLFAMVDADYKFVWCDIGAKGAASDAQVFAACELRHYLETNQLPVPDAEPLPHDTEDVPYFLVGDDAFPLRTFLMKPYGRRGLSREERLYNYRLSRARRVVENAFGILANRFQVLLTTMQHNPETVKMIVHTCVLLHNLMRTRYPHMQNQLVDNDRRGQLVPGAWRRGRNLDDTLVPRGRNLANTEGKAQRNLLKHWVNSEAGSVHWQNDMIV